MFFYCKKIIYLSLMKEKEREASAGFARFTEESSELRLEIHIKGIKGAEDGKYAVCFAMREGEEKIADCLMQNGALNMDRSFAKRKASLLIGDQAVLWEEICGITVLLDEHRKICGYWKEADRQPLHSAEKQESAAQVCLPSESGFPSQDSFRPEQSCRPAKSPQEKPIPLMLEAADDDKWKQLLRSYKQVHPFGDERTFIAIEPKDFIILQAPYQKLVNNSFLLHGFYNYRHMILGEDKAMGNGQEKCFYLGVPGTYFEREKKVAVMFGFEGFESDGAIEIGKFGYYLRHVEI